MKKLLSIGFILLLIFLFGRVVGAKELYTADYFFRAGSVVDMEKLTKAAEQGDVKSQSLLAGIYIRGNEKVHKDINKAIKWYKKAAKQGDNCSQYLLGEVYYRGEEIRQDLKEAVKWYSMAAEGEKGYSIAASILGDIYYYNRNNKQAAIKWYCKSFKLDHFDKITVTDDDKLHYRYADYKKIIDAKPYEFNKTLRLANQGNIIDQLRMGYFYALGDAGRPKDNKEAVKWFHKAAEQGDPYAQFLCGMLHYCAKGYPHDFKEAAKWFRKAALQSDCCAQCALGVMYFEGLGVPQNFIYAHAWSSIAACQGNRDAEKCRDIISKQFMRDGQISTAQKLATELQYLIDQQKEGLQSSSPKASATCEPRVNGVGTGFIITKNGYIITCHHVIDNAESIKVCIGEKIYLAKVIVDDKHNDLTLLKIPGFFTALAFSEERSAKMGQEVFTIGFPNPDIQGLNAKLTKGSINSLSGFQDDPRLYQISTPVQPGNSGGPLLDDKGNVVGIIVAALDAKAVFQVSGSLPQNVNYSIKSIYAQVLLNTVPEVVSILLPPKNSGNFDKMVNNVKKSVVMVLSYK